MISVEKLISNHNLIPHWHSAFAQAVDTYLDEGLICFFHFNKGALYLIEALEMEADGEVLDSLLQNNNDNKLNNGSLPLFIQSSKQQYKQTSAHFISISEIRGFI